MRIAHTCGYPSDAEDCGPEAGAPARVRLCGVLGRGNGTLSVTETTSTANRALVDTHRKLFRANNKPLCFKADATECPPAPPPGGHASETADVYRRQRRVVVRCGGGDDSVTLRSLQLRTFVIEVAA